jgi:cobalamin-dependent methionine synthase I
MRHKAILIHGNGGSSARTWTFFFTAWEMKGRFPEMQDHPQQGAEARELYEPPRRC